MLKKITAGRVLVLLIVLTPCSGWQLPLSGLGAKNWIAGAVCALGFFIKNEWPFFLPHKSSLEKWSESSITLIKFKKEAFKIQKYTQKEEHKKCSNCPSNAWTAYSFSCQFRCSGAQNKQISINSLHRDENGKICKKFCPGTALVCLAAGATVCAFVFHHVAKVPSIVGKVVQKVREA